jgi:hypothetical protein
MGISQSGLIPFTSSGHSTHFQVGGENRRGWSCKTSMQNKAVFYFHFDIFIFENKVAGQFARLL